MAATNFSTSNQTFRQLFGNDLTYRVPPFQRDYSWQDDDWTELWQDIMNVLSGQESSHYMGYLVLKSSLPKTVDVIDGQQRMTTLSLLVLAVLRCLDDLIRERVDPERNTKRLEQLRSSYIGYLDPVSLVTKPKLILNRHNDFFYREKLVALQRIQPRGLKVAERHLRKASEWFYQKVAATYGVSKDGAALAKFIDDLADKLLFAAIYVTDELNAYKVFETLNARGVRLSPTDLLKNYLFSVVDREDHSEQNLETLERYWEEIVEQLGSEDFSAFLRVYWNSRHDFVREAELFKTISSAVRERGAVFELVRRMKDDLNIYLALINPSADTTWSPEQRRYLEDLNLYGIRQLLALLLASRRHMDDGEFTKLLRACCVITLRYSIISGQANNLLESNYSVASRRVASGELGNASEVLQAIRAVYVSDEIFERNFVEKDISPQGRGVKLAKHILFAIERHLSGISHSADAPTYTLEHVLPENPQEKWPEFSDDEHEESVYKIGNLTMLGASANRGLGNAVFARKREVFATSEFQITGRLAGYATWTKIEIAEHQKWLAQQAKAVWRVSQFDREA